jgi:hypothetical protein
MEPNHHHPDVSLNAVRFNVMMQVVSVTDGAQAQLSAVAAGGELPKAEAEALKKRKLIKLE